MKKIFAVAMCLVLVACNQKESGGVTPVQIQHNMACHAQGKDNDCVLDKTVCAGPDCPKAE